jgi:uncharacterized protein YdcH (DUF465 family)
MPSKEITTLLESKQTQLTKRIAAIEADFHKGRSQDFSEQATETENDDVLDEIHHEFPDLTDEIHLLKMNDKLFAKLFTEYHEVNRIEQGVENTSDEYLEGKKKLRLKLKDKLFVMLRKVQMPV